MPSRAAVRTGLVSTSALALALLAGSPALADDLVPQIGDTCTADTTLPTELVCLNGLVAPAPLPADSPAAAPTPTDPPAGDPAPAGSASDPAPSAPPPDVAVPVPPVDIPPVLGGNDVPPVLDPGTGGGATPVEPTLPGQPTAGGAQPDPAPKPGTSLHAAATVSNLASSDLPTLAALRSVRLSPGTAGQPLSAYMPSPLLANLPANLPAATALSSVQAPLLAVGDDAANGGGFTLAGLSSRALPGLLVVLATALVASVSAGNLRYWQDRFGARR